MSEKSFFANCDYAYQGLTQTPACKLDKAFHGKTRPILSFRKRFNAITALNRAAANPNRKLLFRKLAITRVDIVPELRYAN